MVRNEVHRHGGIRIGLHTGVPRCIKVGGRGPAGSFLEVVVIGGEHLSELLPHGEVEGAVQGTSCKGIGKEPFWI